MLTKTAIPTPAELQDRARRIAATLPSYAKYANEKRDIHPDVIQAIHDAGLFRMLKPIRYGGYESDPRDFYAIEHILAEECLSTAWVFAVLSIQSFVLALFPEGAQQDIWGDTPDMLASSAFKPSGKVTAVEGGYRLSGQWTFSSGSTHAGWAWLGGMVPPASEGAPPELRLFLVPRADYDIIDTWHTFGLRGTGSNDVRLEDVFIPAHRTWKPTYSMTVEAEGTGPDLYRLPWSYVFPSCIVNLAIGAGRKAVRVIAERAPTSETDKLTLARAYAEVEGATIRLDNHIAAMRGYVERREGMPMTEAMLYKTELTSILRQIASHVDALMLMTGGRGIAEDGPLTQLWLDLSAARHQTSNIPELAALGLADSLIAG